MAVAGLRKLAGWLRLALAAVLGLAIWAGVTLLATRPAFRGVYDVSPQAHFSVGPQTRKLLEDVRVEGRELRIDTFYTPLMRPATELQAHQFAIIGRVQELTTDLLRMYASLGGDAVEIVHHDVRRDVQKTRERIRELGGLNRENSVVISLGKRHKVLSLLMDMAVIDTPGGQAPVAPGARPTFPSLRMYKGEEAISSAIRSLLVEGRPKVYFLKSGSVSLTEGTADSYSELVGALTDEGFEVGIWDLAKAGSVPDDATIVALLEPRREITDAAAEALFAFVRGGGRLFVNVAFVAVQGWNPTLDRLGALLGFELGRDLVCHLIPDPSMPNQPGRGGPGADNLTILDLPPHPVTDPLRQNARYPVLKSARELRARQGGALDGIQVDPFLTTGPWAWIAPRVGAAGDVDLAAPARREVFESRSVGAIIDVDSGDPTRPGHAVIVSGLAFLNGGGFQYNGDLALNIFNWMAERRELVTIRGNRYRSEKIELAPQQIERIKTLLRLFVPVGLLAIAIAVFLVRRRS